MPRLLLKKFDTYLATEIAGPFFGGIFFFAFVFLMFQALRLAEFFIVHGIAGRVLLKLVFLMVLSCLPMAVPVSFLIAVLVAFGRLSSDSELVAMKASGVSIHRIAVPVAALSLIAVAFSLALNMEWVPWGENRFKTILTKVGNTKVVSSIKEGTFTSDFFDLLLFADKVDPDTRQMTHVFLYDEREEKDPNIVISKTGDLLPLREDSSFGSSAILRLNTGNIHRNEIETETYQRINFGTYELYLEVEEGEDVSIIKPKRLSYDQLIRKIQNEDSTPQTSRECLTELWRRFTLAMSPLIFVFLGIGFGTIPTRSVRAGALLITLFTVVLYWGSQAIVTSWAYDGKLPPAVAMQIPNLLILSCAVLGYRKSAW